VIIIAKSIVDHLKIEENKLYLDNVDLLDVAKTYGTPIIIFSESRIRENTNDVLMAFKKYYDKSYVYYALKANSVLSIIKVIKEEKLNCEVSSYGELFKAIIAGYRPDEIILNGPGKTLNDLENAIKLNIHCINVDSFYELKLIDSIAERLKTKVKISLRIVPEIVSPILKTGVSTSKFGFEKNEIIKAYKLALSLKNIEVKGIHAHFGSQISDINTWIHGLNVLVNIANKIYKELDLELEHINIGGGLPIDYTKSLVMTDYDIPEYFKPSFNEIDVARVVAESFKDLKFDVDLYIEPGRRIIADAGILLTQVVNYKERSFNEKWLIVDAGFNILPSARILQWYYPILNVSKINEKHDSAFRIGGPICDAHDVYHDLDGEEKGKPKLPKYRFLPKSSSPGDILAVLHVGAYGPEIMMNFNGMLRPPIIMISNKSVKIIRRGDRIGDFIIYEEI
jgi:diaminopimelate decarboxylase